MCLFDEIRALEASQAADFRAQKKMIFRINFVLFDRQSRVKKKNSRGLG